MRLSEAVLLGLPEIRFTNETWVIYDSDGEVCEGCLVGCALKAVGQKSHLHLGPTLLFEHWPWTQRPCYGIVCPVCGFYNYGSVNGFASILTDLASHYLQKKITAEQIADFIRSIEPEEPCEQAEQESTQVERVTR